MVRQLFDRQYLAFFAVALGVLLGCNDSTGPVPDEVLVNASSSMVQVGDSVGLVASYRFGTADQPSDRRVRWSSSDTSSFVIDGAGYGHALKYTGMPVTVTATASGVSGTAEVHVLPTFDSLVVTVSARVKIGRTVRPTFAVSAVAFTGRYYQELPELPSLVSLKSSNEQVVAVQPDGSLRAVGNGQAEISATLGRDTARVLVDVFSGYPLTPIAGSANYFVNGVNDAGDIVGTQTGGLNFLRRGDVVTDLGTCLPSDINNAGAVACTVQVACGASCVTTKAGVFENGSLQLLDESVGASASGVSESGVVFGQGRDSSGAGGDIREFVWDAAGVSYLPPPNLALWRGPTYSVNSSGHGVGVFTANTYDASELAGRSFRVALVALSGRWARARDVNDSDDVVGASENMAGGGTATIWRAANKWKPESPGYRATDAVGITESRQVVGHGRDGPYVSTAGRYTILADALADDSWTITKVVAVSHTHVIAAEAQNASGAKSIVLIDIGEVP
jgi:hypothetical protein